MHFLETGKDAATQARNLHPWEEEAWWGSLAFGRALSSFLAANITCLWDYTRLSDTVHVID